MALTLQAQRYAAGGTCGCLCRGRAERRRGEGRTPVLACLAACLPDQRFCSPACMPARLPCLPRVR